MKKNIINFTIILSFVFSSVSIYAQKEYKLIPMDSIQGLDVSEEFALCKQHIYEKSQITLVKDEFEKSSDFDIRVEKAKKSYEIISYEYGKNALLQPLDIDSLDNVAFSYFLKKNKVEVNFELGEYDSENEFFSVNVSFAYKGERRQYGTFKIPIPIKDAKDFKNYEQSGNYNIHWQYHLDDTTNFLTITNARYISFYEYVDLGLSVRWASCNANSPAPEYNGHNYRFLDALKLHEELDGRIPSRNEFRELIANCDRVWTTENDVPGFKFTSKKNGKSIFLPVTWNGCPNYSHGDGGYYWFFDPMDFDHAYYFHIHDGDGQFYASDPLFDCRRAVRLVQDVK